MGSSSPSGLTNSMLWYCVILPYARLMNTTYNKDRIVDDGWKSVIINLFQSIVKCLGITRLGNREQNQGPENPPKNNIPSCKTKTRSTSNNPEPDISVISLENLPHESDTTPCTSDGRTHDEVARRKIQNQHRSQSSPDLDEDVLCREAQKLSV